MTTAAKSVKSLQRIAPEPASIKNILCLTDFSPASTAARGYALSVARRFEAKVYLTHIVAPPIAAPRPAAFYEGGRPRSSDGRRDDVGKINLRFKTTSYGQRITARGGRGR